MIVFLIPHALPIASLKQRDNPPIANKDFFYRNCSLKYRQKNSDTPHQLNVSKPLSLLPYFLVGSFITTILIFFHFTL